jgi:(p)ppGpp synthase/HD superfamily hydrolase
VSTLERAIALAAEKHAGQTDKGHAPYILHPLRVMLRVSTNEERIVAVLHDVVEDCGVTLAALRAEGFSESVLRAIDSVTKRKDETYEAFVDRAGADPIGRRVKMADLEDNSDLTRIANPTEHDYERVRKYARAMQRLRLIRE